jgi:hypothetical protein
MDMAEPEAEAKLGWRPKEFMRATGIRSRQTLDNLIARGEIKKVKVGWMAILVTTPREFLERKQREPEPPSPPRRRPGSRPRGRPRKSAPATAGASGLDPTPPLAAMPE